MEHTAVENSALVLDPVALHFHKKSSHGFFVTPQKYPRIFIIILLYIPGIKLIQNWVFSGKLINC